jgi:hypothetical protein
MDSPVPDRRIVRQPTDDSIATIGDRRYNAESTIEDRRYDHEK